MIGVDDHNIGLVIKATMQTSLDSKFAQKQEDASEYLSVLEEQAWSLCSSINDFRILLRQIEDLREQIQLS